MSSSIPIIENCCVKETYAFYGLAVYIAQVLERSAINLAFAISLPEVNLATRELAEELNRKFEKKTLGNLLHFCRDFADIDGDLEAKLFDALATRNRLVHSYFWERAEDFLSQTGQLQMKEELQVIIGQLEQADELLEGLYFPLLEKYGITEEYVQQGLDSMVERAAIRDKDA